MRALTRGSRSARVAAVVGVRFEGGVEVDGRAVRGLIVFVLGIGLGLV